MKKTKRWGKKITFKRNWKEVNERYALRGEYLLDFEWVKSWNNELEEMNRGKRGAPFEFPESLIRLQAVWTQYHSYRVAEGMTRMVVVYSALPKFNDYTTIFKRVKKIDADMPEPKIKKFSLSTDGSGMKMNMGCEYFQEMYGDKKRKKYIKVVITSDPVDKDIFKIDVSLEGEGDSEPEIAEDHMRQLINEGFEIEGFYGDGSFDTNPLFDFCDLNNIDPKIKIRENAIQDPKGSWRRNKEVEKYQKDGYKKWAKKKGYGRRWTGTEGIFSAVKRIMGDRVRSKLIENMCLEVSRRFWAYQTIKRYAEERI